MSTVSETSAKEMVVYSVTHFNGFLVPFDVGETLLGLEGYYPSPSSVDFSALFAKHEEQKQTATVETAQEPETVSVNDKWGFIMKSWKTTLMGLFGLISVVAKVATTKTIMPEDFASASMAIGLITAKDH